MKSLVHTEEICSRSVPLEHAPGAKSLVCIGLKKNVTFYITIPQPPVIGRGHFHADDTTKTTRISFLLSYYVVDPDLNKETKN